MSSRLYDMLHLITHELGIVGMTALHANTHCLSMLMSLFMQEKKWTLAIIMGASSNQATPNVLVHD